MLYYFWLLNKKIRTKIHNYLEKRKFSLDIPSIDYVNFFLWNFLGKRLVHTEKGIYYKTKIMNNNSPMTLAQSRVLLGVCNLYNSGQSNDNNIFLIKEIQKYILTMKGENGIYKFNQKSWNLQDEGIATIWVLLALLETYKITLEKTLLEEIIATIEIVNKILFSKKNSLSHTLGDDYWCLNAASTYAWFVGELMTFYKTDELIENYSLSIELCNAKFSEKRYFPYSEKRQGTYLLLYNPVVMFTLQEAIKNKFIDKTLYNKTRETLVEAEKYLLSQLDKNNFFVEPEMKVFSRYIITNVISLVALKDKIGTALEDKVLNNIKSYFNNDKMFLCKDDSGKYYDGNLYEVDDVLTIEVFYWLTTYLYR